MSVHGSAPLIHLLMLSLPRQKDPEFANLSRFIEMTQLWAHRMYPKGQFSDTVERVEKLCHSRRMVVSKLSVSTN